MQHEYSKESGSSFPQTIMELTHYKDIDETAAPVIAEIYRAQDEDDYETAGRLLSENEALLSPYMINCRLLNKLSEELYNTQIFSYTTLQQIFVSKEEPAVKMRKYDFWEQDY